MVLNYPNIQKFSSNNPSFYQSQESGQLITTTVRDYDLSETSKLVRSSIHYYSFVHTFNISLQLRSSYMGIAMMAVMHLYFHFTQPLFIQSLMGFKGLYDAKLVSIHLLGKPATGDLKRPFKAASMFGGKVFLFILHFLYLRAISIATTGPQTDAASIAEAEKRVGKKEE